MLTVNPEGGFQTKRFTRPSGDVPQKSSSTGGTSGQGSGAQNPPVKSSTGTSVLLKQAFISLGLNQDGLNKALFIFSRFFSLPAGKASNPGGFLTELKREILNKYQAGISDEAAGDRSKNENRALAVTSLADKGVTLSRNAFEIYAGIQELPAGDEGQDTPPGEEQYNRNEGNEHGGANNDKSEQGQGGNGDRNRDNDKKEPTPEELRALFDEFMGTNGAKNGVKEHILQFLNVIPGKNGQRWIVWPFSIENNGQEFKILVRLLLKEPLSAAQGCLIVNVSGPSNTWRFILDRSGERFRADISVYPERRPSALKALKKEAQKLLSALGPVEIKVGNGEKYHLLEDFLENEVLFSVNEKA